MYEYLNSFIRQKNTLFIKNLLIFAGIFLGIFVVTFSVLGALGLIPSEFARESNDGTVAAQLTETTLTGLGLIPEHKNLTTAQINASSGEFPFRLVAPSIGLDTAVIRPSSANFNVLDNALSKGAVYYPGSGLAGNGNMFIFGHSTGYQYVNNKAYQVFNKVKDLKEGDTVEIYGENKVYIYKVSEVKIVNASEALVEFSNSRSMLTLSTCDSFGQKSDRYVAEADLVSTRSL